MNNKQFDYLDLITMLSFVIGIQSYELASANLVENRQQSEDTRKILQELQDHLHEQDRILLNQDKILYKLDRKEK